MDKVIKADQVLDTSGMLCPMPIIKTTKAIKEIETIVKRERDKSLKLQLEKHLARLKSMVKSDKK